MNCRYCGTTLQVGALFCVECGRSVAEASAPPAPVSSAPPPPRSSAAPVAPVAPAAPSSTPPSPAPASPDAVRAPHCPQCGVVIDPADIFCGECGFVLRPMTGAVPTAEAPSERLEAAPPAEEVESTRVMASRGGGERYVLQFSTGESFVVAGSGLIGRNPAPEPGEYVDELVAIFDVAKSVSKSHVEFGQDAGRFWVSDRYSTNGTIVRQPDAGPVRCEPGRRYLLARGSRVEIGEQFFVVS